MVVGNQYPDCAEGICMHVTLRVIRILCRRGRDSISKRILKLRRLPTTSCSKFYDKKGKSAPGDETDMTVIEETQGPHPAGGSNQFLSGYRRNISEKRSH